ncbi:MFS-type transporter SLC18B1-like isoform X2 [Acanthaster planci]|uniref:MFS-type transporter SLC18B1-like isoform X2 n=1 Tax=Acanthaster planci TaxID=133434 RepID=A0A8B7YS09_ACAPL|nr:MFS-type transporter SLC18B1-like isoform X2 [Acanthaster planci]
MTIRMTENNSEDAVLPSESAAPNDESSEKEETTFHKKATFVCAALGTFTAWLTFSVIAVFFPNEAKARGMSQTVIGLVFSSFSVAAGISSPIWGKLLPLIGARFAFLAGAFVAGSCNILFGFIIDMPTDATFTAFSFAIRLLEGLGSSACATSTAAILAYTFPENVGMSMSLFETCAGVAFAVGPAAGGLLFEAGGFRVPFFVLGGAVLATVGASCFFMPDHGSEEKQSGPIVQVLKIPAVWVCMLAICANFIGFTALHPILSVHLETLDFSVLGRSLLFCCLGVSYAVGTVVWGYVVDKKKCTRTVISLGTFGAVIGFFLLGPSPVLNITPWYGIPYNMGLVGIISGLWNMAVSIGMMVGPMLASWLTDCLGFGYATTIIACGFLAVWLVLCFFGAWEYRCGKGRRPPMEEPKDDSHTDFEEMVLLSKAP